MPFRIADAITTKRPSIETPSIESGCWRRARRRLVKLFYRRHVVCRPSKRMAAKLDGVVVLVVEDALAAMRLFLERHGALVFPATDAAAAVAVLDRIKPSVLVSDIMMPVADGWWVVAEARRRGHLQDVPRVAVTALDLRPEDLSEGGFDAYLRKPVDPEALCATIHSLARGERRSA